ncbi:hypothetical protein WHR41_03888 [Cladosporium halotolerans]|uniref:RPEL repeat protein n=1 Tax=Cladosporium halotolerans TaxID=1052096 RepID=A0AB34KUC6_9PEZI
MKRNAHRSPGVASRLLVSRVAERPCQFRHARNDAHVRVSPGSETRRLAAFVDRHALSSGSLSLGALGNRQVGRYLTYHRCRRPPRATSALEASHTPYLACSSPPASHPFILHKHPSPTHPTTTTITNPTHRHPTHPPPTPTMADRTPSLPTSASDGVDASPISPVERRNSLEKHLQTRPDAEDLKNRHILLDTAAAPALQAKQAELERQRNTDNLKKGLSRRMERGELVERNILPDSTAAPALQGHQKDLEKHMRADSLEKQLQNRPKPDDLIREGILQADENPLGNS